MNYSNIPGMKSYLVGGAVRDQLLGLPVNDRDWLVTGASGEQLIAGGFRKVGQDFPVFLHPRTAEEYALPRGGHEDQDERQQIEEDLIRRDLTINAIAQAADGHYIDPLDGRGDITARLLRHTPTFHADPIRVLRLSRLHARLAPLGFRVADETCRLVRTMASTGALNRLVPERVWAELLRVLQGDNPSQFFQTLRDLQVLQNILPELDRLFGVPQPAQHHPEIDTGVHSLMVLTQAAALSDDPEVRWAALLHDLGKGTTPPARWPSHHRHEERGAKLVDQRCLSLRVPNRFRQLSRLVAAYHTHCHRALELKPGTLLKTLMAVDGLRRPPRLRQFLLACEADARGRSGFEQRPYPQAAFMEAAATAAAAVDSAAVAAKVDRPEQIPGQLFQARSAAISAIKKQWQSHPGKASE